MIHTIIPAFANREFPSIHELSMKYKELPFQHYHRTGEDARDTLASHLQSSQPQAAQPLVREVAVGFSYNGLNHAVMMATPDALEDFALGFSFTSGIIEQRQQILDIDMTEVEEGVALEITLSQRALNQLKHLRRNLAGTSGCGLCGAEALSQALSIDPASIDTASTDASSTNIAAHKKYSRDGFPSLPPADHFAQLRERFLTAQEDRQLRGAMHCALYVDRSGETRLWREDIGRHNALDKLVGACLADGIDLHRGFVAITSRCSLELIQKSVRAGIGTLISLSSPSDISVRWAQRYRLNLLHQPAGDVARLYSGAEQ